MNAKCHIVFTNSDDISLKQSDVLEFIPFGDQGNEVQIAADVITTARGALLELDLKNIVCDSNALSNVEGVKDCGEDCRASADPAGSSWFL